MTTQVISGMVVRYDHEKDFGFAETRDLGNKIERVFFAIEDARKVVDEDGELRLTSDQDPEANPRALRNNPQWLIMQVYQTSRGWRAYKWGHRPGPNWIHDFIRANTMSQFVGGTIEEVFIDKDGVPTSEPFITGTLVSAELKPNGINQVVRREVEGCMTDIHGGHGLSRATHEFVGSGKLAITIHYTPSDNCREAARRVTYTMAGFE